MNHPWYNFVPTWMLDDPIARGAESLSLWRDTPDGTIWSRMRLKDQMRAVFADLQEAGADPDTIAGVCTANALVLEACSHGLPGWFLEFEERLMALDAPPFIPATRAIRNVIIGLVGESTGGKTCSALRIARGIAGPAGRIVVIDSEYGRPTEFAPMDGEAVSDTFDPALPLFDFACLSLTPPFEPLAYRKAAHDASKLQPSVLIIDNISDEHFAMCDMADATGSKAHGSNWLKPRGDHRKLMAKLRLHPWYVILCVRARAVLIENKDKGEVKGGLHQMCESGLVADSTIWQLVRNGGYPFDAPGVPTKWPAALRGRAPSKEPLGEEVGRLIARWAQPTGGWVDNEDS